MSIKIWQKQQENLTLYHLKKCQILMENTLEIKIFTLQRDAWGVYKQYQCNFIPQTSLFQRFFEIYVFWWNSSCLSLLQNKHFVLVYFHMVFCNIFAFENKSLSLKLKKIALFWQYFAKTIKYFAINCKMCEIVL